VANIGGEIAGIRMVCRTGGDPASIAASVVVEVLLTIINQLVFAVAGVLILLRLTGKVAIAWQLAGSAAGAIETWLVLRWLQHPVGIGTALALESLTQAIRHFIFVVPAGLGVQEAGLVGFGYLVGLGNDASIALSLAKRMREILFGVPALLYWQLK
jgi:hypothetical protein